VPTVPDSIALLRGFDKAVGRPAAPDVAEFRSGR
jgi:hypothetical protein